MSSDNNHVWGWINPTTLIKETLGVLIASETLTGGGHGNHIRQTYRLDGVDRIIEGYMGQGMPLNKGLGSLYQVN